MRVDASASGAKLEKNVKENALKAKWGVVVASMAALTVSSTSIGFYTQGLFLGPMTHAFGWSVPGYFSAVLVGGLAAAACTPASGALLDRFGVRPVLLTAILLYGLANAAMAFVGPSLPIYIALTSLIAALGVLQGPLSYTKVVAGWFDRRRGLALALTLSGTGLGGFLVAPYVAALIHAFGWRVARLGLGAAVLAVALPAVALFVRESPGARRVKGGEEPPSASGTTLSQAMGTRNFWLLSASFLLSSAVVNGALANLTPLVRSHGASSAIGAAALSSLAAGQIAGRFLSGFLVDAVQSSKVGAVLFAVAAAGLAILQFGGSPPLFLVGAFLVGCGVGAELEMAGVFISRLFGQRHFGKIYGAVFGSYMVGASVGPVCAGLLLTGHDDYQRAVLTGLGALGGAAALLFGIGRYIYLPDRAVASDDVGLSAT